MRVAVTLATIATVLLVFMAFGWAIHPGTVVIWVAILSMAAYRDATAKDY